MAWSRLQSNGGDAGTGTSYGIAYTSNLSSGSTLIVVSMPYQTTTSSVKDTAGNSFIKIAAIGLGNVVSSFGEVSLWALNTPSGDIGIKPTITATYAASTIGSALVIQEISGLATGVTLAELCDGTPAVNYGISTSNFNATWGAYSSTAIDEYLVAVYADSQPNADTAGTPTGSTTYTADPNNQQNTDIVDASIFYGNSTNGAETATSAVTGVSGSDGWATIFVAFLLGGPSITTTSLPDAVEGFAYSATLEATGGATPYTWSISSGSLPGWASLNTSSGVITGTPTSLGTTSFTVKVTDNASLTATQSLSITVILNQSLQSAWPGYPAPGLFVPGKLIFYSTSQQYTKTLAAVIASTAATPNHSIRKIVKASVIAVPVVSRKIFRIIIAGLAIVTAVARSVQRTLTGNIAATMTLAAGRLLHATLTATLAATVSAQKTIGRILASVTAVTAGLGRKTSRMITGVLTASAATARVTGRTLTATVTAAAVLPVSKLKQIAFAVTVAVTSVTQHSITRIINSQIAVSEVLTRNLTKNISALAVTTASMARRITRTIAASVVTTAAVAITKFKQVTLATAVTVTSVLPRNVSKLTNGQVAVSGTLTRTLSRVLAGMVTVSVRIVRVTGKYLTSMVTATGSVKRSALKIFSAVTVVAPVAARRISKNIAAFLSTAAQVTVFQPGKVIIDTLLYIILPGGGYKRVTASFNVTLPLPKTSFTGFPGTFGIITVKLPEPETSFSASVTHPLTIILPKPEISFTGTDWYARLSVTLPKPEIPLLGQAGHIGPWTVQFGETPLKLVQQFLGLEEDQGEPPYYTVAPLRVNWKAGMPGTEWTVGYNSSNISQLSTEYVLVPVAATKAGAPYNPTSDTVQFAFASTATYVPQTSDWKTGSWDTDTSSIIYPYNAKCLVGPNGVITLGLGTYIVYIKISDNPETPVLVAGQLTIS